MEIIKLVVGALQTNCYIICKNGKAVCIDPGSDAPYINKILSEHGCCLTYVFLTHAHFDHIMALEELEKQYPELKVCVYKDEKELLNDPIKNCMSEFAGREVYFHSDLITSFDGEIISTPIGDFKVIHTPGHTKGSCCYIYEKMMFTGDTLFENGAGRTDLPTGDTNDLLSSLKKLKEIKGDYDVLPGHGNTSTLEKEKNKNPYLLYMR